MNGMNLETVSKEMIASALNGEKLSALYDEITIQRVIRFNLEKKYPKKTFLMKSFDGKQVLATNADIEDHVLNLRAPGLNVGVKNNGFIVLEAKNIIDLFTCLVLLDEAR